MTELKIVGLTQTMLFGQSEVLSELVIELPDGSELAVPITDYQLTMLTTAMGPFIGEADEGEPLVVIEDLPEAEPGTLDPVPVAAPLYAKLEDVVYEDEEETVAPAEEGFDTLDQF